MVALAWPSALAAAGDLLAADWPTFRHDNRRSGATTETIPAASLGEAWVHRAPHPPQPAWAGPAKVDAFRKIRQLGSMRNYDPVFHTIVVGGRVYFGSSVDDAVHCLDAASGEPRWTFTTQGPIRVAPSFAGGKIYFGSDDGFAYAVDAATGSLVWKFRPVEAPRLILNNGRLISPWPCRTGVLVADGMAYFGASMLPWKASYLCAVDAETGKPDGPHAYVKKFDEGFSLEAAMVASATRLFAPQGRVSPLMFRCRDGTNLGGFSGSGTFALLTDDDEFFSGPPSRDVSLSASRVQDRLQVASHPGATAIVVAGKKTFLMRDGSVAAVDRGSQEHQWTTSGRFGASLILAGDYLFAGGDGQVAAIRAKDGKQVWQSEVSGRAFGLAAGDGALFVSTDEGAIYCFRPDAQPAAKATTEPSDPTDAAQPPETPAPMAIKLAAGPHSRFTSPDTAVIYWQTDKPSPTILEYGLDQRDRRFENAQLTTNHVATITGLGRNRDYTYQIKTIIAGQAGNGPTGVLETFFNYTLPDVSARKSPYPADDAAALYADAADGILKRSGIADGICLVYGCGEGRLAFELARKSNLRVIGLETDPAMVERARRALQEADVYGARVSVLQVDSLDRLPLPSFVANLIVSDRMLDSEKPVGRVTEISRVLRPDGGVVCLRRPVGADPKLAAAQLNEWLEPSPLKFEVSNGPEGLWAVARRGKLPGVGDWSHQYGGGHNAAYAGESLRGARAATDFDVQWVGRPGPRYHTDRQNRKPAPLSTGGRLFIQGFGRMIAADAYNGSVLWSLEIPQFYRFNIPHDAGNWSADDQFVFAAVASQLWQIDAPTGRVVRRIPVRPGPIDSFAYDWGYVGYHGDKILGSANKQGAAYTAWWGGSYWYDQPGHAIVASENLFALDKQTGEHRWTYADGIILNPSITIGEDRVYFVESRDERVKESYQGRVGMGGAWPGQYLVALDLDSGKKVWEKPIDVVGGESMFSLAYAEGKLVIVSSAYKKYHLYTYNAADGADVWRKSFPWPAEGHGAHFSRPVIVGSTLFVRPAAFDLETGKRLEKTMPGGGCGSYCASEHAVFFRSGDVTAWAPDTDQVSGWSRLRPGCWLSTIPAAGLLLSPEAGGGCSCGIWMETSMAFAPSDRPPPSLKNRSRSFIDATDVELFNHRPGGTIRYTLDGSDPTKDSPTYTGPVEITHSLTVKARTFWDDDPAGAPTASEIVTASLTRNYPAPAFASRTTTFVDSLPVELNKNGKTGTIHYTLDGTEPTRESPVYTGPVTLRESAPFQARTYWDNPTHGEAIASTVIRRDFEHVQKKLAREANINFQHASWEAPKGYEIDSGDMFRVHPSGHYFGWSKDMRGRIRSRGRQDDRLQLTFIKFMADTAWEIEVDAGEYEVTVCIGETHYGTERGTIYVEGIEFCKDVVLPRGVTKRFTKTVDVTDGRISVTSHEDSAVQRATRLNYIQIRKKP